MGTGITGSAMGTGITGSAMGTGITGSAMGTGITGSAMGKGITGSAMGTGIPSNDYCHSVTSMIDCMHLGSYQSDDLGEYLIHLECVLYMLFPKVRLWF